MSISADIRRYLPIFTDICRYSPIYADICRYLLICLFCGFVGLECKFLLQYHIHRYVMSTPAQKGLKWCKGESADNLKNWRKGRYCQEELLFLIDWSTHQHYHAASFFADFAVEFTYFSAIKLGFSVLINIFALLFLSRISLLCFSFLLYCCFEREKKEREVSFSLQHQIIRFL